MRKLRWLPLVLLITSSRAAFALPYVFDEQTLGDFSNDGLSPTSLSFNPGSDLVYGTTGRTTATDRDYFTFTIAPGFELAHLSELEGTEVGGSVSFIGIQAGPQVTVATNATDATGLLGWAHYGPTDTSTTIDLLPQMGTNGLGSTGFTPPLGPGTYSIWIQDFGSGTFHYGFDFSVFSVPEPASAVLALLGISLGVAVHTLRSRRTSSR